MGRGSKRSQYPPGQIQSTLKNEHYLMESTFLASKPEEETYVAGDPQQPHRHLG